MTLKSFKGVREEVRRGYHGRGWHGEPVRHGLASKGIRTARKIQAQTRPTLARDSRIMERANLKMDRILDFQDTFVYRQPSVEEQDKLTKDLDDIIEMMATVNLGHLWLDVEQAIMDIDDAWSTKSETTRIVTLEVARERLHYIITSYLREGGKIEEIPEY